MSLLAEKTLLRLLPDLESLEHLLREGFHEQVLPTEELVPVVDWSLNYFTASGKAPTVQVLSERFGDTLTDFEIDLDEEPEESIQWAMETLRATYLRKVSADFARKFATEVSTCAPEDRLKVMSEFSSLLGGIVSDLAPQTSRVDLRESAQRIITQHDLVAEDPTAIRGLAFGLDQIDEYYGGTHPGEVCIVAGGPKTGKSFFLDWVALKEWERQRVTALYTLENSIEMTEMRIACMANQISIQEVQTGRLNDRDRTTLQEWINDVLRASNTPLHIMQPPVGQRTPQAIVQQAMAHEADSLIVDQLTFVEPGRRRKDQSRVYEMAETMRDFKTLVSAGQYKVPLLMAHQINREGIKAADKTGWLNMSNMADSSEVERASDLVFGLYAPEDMREHGGMQFQGLACRRLPLKSFDLHWQIAIGAIGVRNEVEFE